MTTPEWREEEHPLFGDNGVEPAKHTEELLGKTNVFPRTIWRKGKFSIVPPCLITSGLWEMYNGNDITRYNTLEEAKAATLR